MAAKGKGSSCQEMVLKSWDGMFGRRSQFKSTSTATSTNNNHDDINKIKFMFWEGVSFDWNTDNQLGTPFREHFSRMEKVR